MAGPDDNRDAATKGYVDDNFLKLNGSQAVTGNLVMNDNTIINLFTGPDLAQSHPDYGTYIKSAVNKLYVTDHF